MGQRAGWGRRWEAGEQEADVPLLPAPEGTALGAEAMPPRPPPRAAGSSPATQFRGQTSAVERQWHSVPRRGVTGRGGEASEEGALGQGPEWVSWSCRYPTEGIEVLLGPEVGPLWLVHGTAMPGSWLECSRNRVRAVGTEASGSAARLVLWEAPGVPGRPAAGLQASLQQVVARLWKTPPKEPRGRRQGVPGAGRGIAVAQAQTERQRGWIRGVLSAEPG